MALLDHDDVKKHLYGTTTPTTYDSTFDALIAQVTAMIEEETGVKAVATAYEAISDEIGSHDGSREIKVKFQPVRACSKVETRNSSWGWDEYTDELPANMEVEKYRIHTQYVPAGKGKRNIRVSYTVGYKTTETPADLKLCAVLLVVQLFNQREDVGIASKSVLGLSETMSNTDYLFVKKILAKYKKTECY